MPYSLADQAMKTLQDTPNNMQERKYKKGIFYIQSCIMDLKLNCFHYKNFDALLLFKARFKRRATAVPN